MRLDLLVAALVWDTPKLVQSGAPDARLFFDAMSRSHLTTRDSVREEPLAIAGLALSDLSEGKQNEALKALDNLAASRERLVRLLALSMEGWLFAEERPSAIPDGIGLAHSTRDKLLRARFLTKFLTYALDAGQHDLAREAWAIAFRFVPQSHPLAFQLRLAALNHRLGAVEISDSALRPPDYYDPLVDYPWIRYRAAHGSHRALLESLRATAQGAWRTTVSFGRTSLDDVLSAEMQATWSGAIWLIPTIRLEAAAHLLMGGATTPQLHEEAVVLWVQSGGQNIDDVINLAERSFAQGSGDRIVTRTAKVLADTPSSHRYEETALALWDLLSEDVAARLLSQLRPTTGDIPFIETSRALWAVLALVSPSAWNDIYASLPLEEREAILEGMTPELVERLNATSAIEVARALKESSWSETPSERRLAVAAQLHAMQLANLNVEYVRQAAPAARAALLPRFHTLLGEGLVDNTIDSLSDLLDEEVRSAKGGQRSFGGRPFASTLARALLASSRHSDSRVRALIAPAADPRVPADLRLEAWQAVNAYSWERPLPKDYRRWIATAPTRGAPSFIGNVTEPLLAILKLSTLASFGYSSRQLPQLLAASRDADPRVRQVAVDTAGNLLRGKAVASLETILLASLYDPKDEIVVVGLKGLRRAGPVTRAVLPAIRTRFAELMQTAGREVRVGVVSAAAGTLSAPESVADLDALLARARSDRSLLVRDEASRINDRGQE